VLGDGAVAIWLTDAESAARSGNKLVEISGWGITNDANHITGPARDGCGLTAAIEGAFRMAGQLPEGIEAFCAHGTGTVYNDGMELAALATVFGKRKLPLFSVKGAIGHTLGAAGGIEAALCVEALKRGKLLPTWGLEEVEPAASGQAAGIPQSFAGNNILSTNSGFGGVNAALLLKHADSAPGAGGDS